MRDAFSALTRFEIAEFLDRGGAGADGADGTMLLERVLTWGILLNASTHPFPDTCPRALCKGDTREADEL